MSDVRAGLIALAVLAVGLYFGFRKENPFDREYRIHAVFASAASEIRPKSPVRIAGVDVGTVRAVQPGPGGTAVVTMKIFDAGRPIHRDATAKLRPRLFLEGNFFVDLEPGSPSASELEAGATIPRPQTAIPVQFDELLSVFTADTRGRLQDLVGGLDRALAGGGARALNAGYDDWEGAFDGLSATMRALRGPRPHALSALIGDQAALSETIATRRARLVSLLSGYRRTLDALASGQDDLRATVRGADALLAAAPPALAALDRAMPAVRELSVVLRPALRIAPPILDRSRPFLARLADLSAPDRLPALARDLAPTATSLAALAPQLQRLLPSVRRVSACVRDNVVPALSKTVPDGVHTTDQPAWQEGLRFGTALAGAQQNFTANGYGTRYSFGLSQDVVVTKLGVGSDVVQLAGQRTLGSSPAFTPGRQPPLRPDAPCEDQAVPDLESRPIGPPPRQRTVRLQPAEAWTEGDLRQRLRAALAPLRRAAR